MSAGDWPVRYSPKDLAKPSRTARKVSAHVIRRKRVKVERDNKLAARKRDGYRCRFPLCGCKPLGLGLEARLEVSHDRHKGAGGNPAGDRSTRDGLITLCTHRHQDGIVSRHKGTLRTKYLTPKKSDGPVAWEIDLDAIHHDRKGERRCGVAQWFEVAREVKVQQLAPLTPRQQKMLEVLAEMAL